MTDNSGALSIDFLVGFTIFMITFIWVATMVPGLFIGLESHSIDFDAVAYRTGVMLAEDPGATSSYVTDGTPWEVQNIVTGKLNVARFGLAVSKETPTILSESKVERFFCATAWTYPADYQSRLIFGDYPYQFNISLKVNGDDQVRYIGNVTPSNYGFIRRAVKVKGASNATINAVPPPTDTVNSSYSMYSIQVNSSELLSDTVRSPAYQIIPQREQIMINITNLTGTLAHDANKVTLVNVTFFQRHYGMDPSLYPLPLTVRNFIYADVNTTPGNTKPVNPPVDLNPKKNQLSNISLIFDRGAFANTENDGIMYINLTFNIDSLSTNPYPLQYLNNSLGRPYNYNYSWATPPSLKDGVLEVAVW
jgi:hypothetical protein